MDHSTPARPRRIVVGISGATGATFGVAVLRRLAAMQVETHLVVSKWARHTIEHETSMTIQDVYRLATHVHAPGDQSSVLSSGSFRTDGMIIAPCSVRSVASIAQGIADNLMLRAADVVLKERKPLILMVRESPFSAIHLANMLTLARLGVSIFPPVPAFYNRPESVEQLVDHIVVRALDQLGIEDPNARRWDGQLGRPGDVPTWPEDPNPDP